MSPCADAVVIVLRDGERVLAVERAAGTPRAHHWSLPSGRVAATEAQADAVVREAREELGLEVRAVAKLWECRTDDGCHLLHWWLAGVAGGTLAPNADEVAQARWVTPAEYLALRPGFPRHRVFFETVWPTLVSA
jgi:8-oxo-dGTP pyrophosphatase MutT (NUDIX family)